MQARVILCAAAVVAMIGLGAATFPHGSVAQPAPAPEVSPGPGARAMPRGPMGMPPWQRRRMMAHNPWGLFPDVADKQLTATDAQTIAQGILLRHGNHSWKIGNVAENQDDTISFAFTTGDGGVVARFAMDKHTGRIRRIG